MRPSSASTLPPVSRFTRIAGREGRYRHEALETRLVKKQRALIVPALVVGIALVVIAAIYWIEPAKSLPGFFPGHEAGSTHHHFKHGIAAFVVGLAVLAFGWFQTGGPRTAAK